jgi:SnoaL-like domain
MIINYLVPFVAASVGYLGARRGVRKSGNSAPLVRVDGHDASGGGTRSASIDGEREGVVTGASMVTAYHDAWTHRDMDTARSCLADDLDFQGPIDTFSSADEFIVALTPFAQMLTRVELLQRFDADDAAALLYDCVTESPAGTIRTAEFFGLRDDKIASIRLVFDATALRQIIGG